MRNGPVSDRFSVLHSFIHAFLSCSMANNGIISRNSSYRADCSLSIDSSDSFFDKFLKNCVIIPYLVNHSSCDFLVLFSRLDHYDLSLILKIIQTACLDQPVVTSDVYTFFLLSHLFNLFLCTF